MTSILTPRQTADAMLQAQPSGTHTLYLGTSTVFNISTEHAKTIRTAIIRGIERDRAQVPREDIGHVITFAERGIAGELGAIDDRHAYTEDELEQAKARFDGARNGIDVLRAVTA